MVGLAQLMMGKTEIVTASNQIHPSLQCRQTTSRMTGFARERGQSLPEGSIQALDKRRVEDVATVREHKQPLSLSHQTMRHLASNLNHPFFLCSLDHCSDVQVWPDLQIGSSHSAGLLDLLPESPTNTVGIGTPAVCQEKQGAQSLSRSANLLHQAISQATITRKLNHSSQPQARRNHHGQTHPGYHAASFHANFIGLNMYQVKRSLLDDGLMHLLTLPACPIPPIRYGALIQTKGMDKSLHWASVGQERHDNDYELRWFTQAKEHRSSAAAEGALADLTAVALPAAIMNDDIALVDLARFGNTPRLGKIVSTCPSAL